MEFIKSITRIHWVIFDTSCSINHTFLLLFQLLKDIQFTCLIRFVRYISSRLKYLWVIGVGLYLMHQIFYIHPILENNGSLNCIYRKPILRSIQVNICFAHVIDFASEHAIKNEKQHKMELKLNGTRGILVSTDDVNLLVGNK